MRVRGIVLPIKAIACPEVSTTCFNEDKRLLVHPDQGHYHSHQHFSFRNVQTLARSKLHALFKKDTHYIRLLQNISNMQFVLLALASLAAAGSALEDCKAPPAYGQQPERQTPPAYGQEPKQPERQTPPAYSPPATLATRPSVAPSVSSPPYYGTPSMETRPITTSRDVRTTTVSGPTVTVTTTVEGRPAVCPTTITSIITVTSVVLPSTTVAIPPSPTGVIPPSPTGVIPPSPTGVIPDEGDDNDGGERIEPCSGLFTPRCCQVDVLGLAGVTCDAGA